MAMQLFAHSCDSLKETSLLLLNKPALKSFSHNKPPIDTSVMCWGGDGHDHCAGFLINSESHFLMQGNPNFNFDSLRGLFYSC